MKTVGLTEMRKHFDSLLDEIARGETIIITRYGKEVAILRPVDQETKRKAAITELRQFKKVPLPEGMTIKDMIEEGRRY